MVPFQSSSLWNEYAYDARLFLSNLIIEASPKGLLPVHYAFSVRRRVFIPSSEASDTQYTVNKLFEDIHIKDKQIRMIIRALMLLCPRYQGTSPSDSCVESDSSH